MTATCKNNVICINCFSLRLLAKAVAFGQRPKGSVDNKSNHPGGTYKPRVYASVYFVNSACDNGYVPEATRESMMRAFCAICINLLTKKESSRRLSSFNVNH